MYLKYDENNQVIGFSTQQQEDWVESDADYTYSYVSNSYIPVTEFDVEAEAQAEKEHEEWVAQQIAEQEEQPTIADLVEALDILTGIVLGGAE